MSIFKSIFGGVKDERPTTSGGVSALRYAPPTPLPIEPTVEEVHREFFTACDQIMEEVNTALAKHTLSKADRLKSFGFEEALDVKASRDLIRKNQIAEVLKKYQLTHPTTKIITIEGIDRICKKYGLIHTAVARFKGFVPEKNLREMENFKYPGEYDVMASSYMGMRGGYSNRVSVHKTKEEAERAAAEITTLHNWGWVRMPQEKINICAPAKDIMLYSNERIENGKIVVPDPVILFPVENSCSLIVTAWGDEASDPEVANEKMN